MSTPILEAEGLVYEDKTLLFCETDGQAEPIDFAPFEGKDVRALISHVPSIYKRDMWGFGACALQPTGFCPFGHHTEPHKLFSMFGDGRLLRRDDWWEIPGLRFPTREVLVGHRCRFLIIPTILEMEIVDTHSPLEHVQSQLTAMADLLAKLKKSR